MTILRKARTSLLLSTTPLLRKSRSKNKRKVRKETRIKAITTRMETVLKAAKKARVVTNMARSSPTVMSKHTAMKSSRTKVSTRKAKRMANKTTAKRRAQRAKATTVRKASPTMAMKRANRISTELAS